MNKNESKYFNTARRMDEALIALLEKKDFEYITIKEICETAKVNRSTFYLHYENLSDLLKETTRYIIDKHLEYYSYDTRGIAEKFQSSEKEDLVFISEEYLTPYLTFIKENQRIFNVAVKQFNTMNFGAVYERMFTSVFDPILARFSVPEKRRAYVVKFYLMGIFAMVMEWLRGNCTDDISEIARIVIDCVLGERDINGRSV